MLTSYGAIKNSEAKDQGVVRVSIYSLSLIGPFTLPPPPPKKKTKQENLADFENHY